MVTTTHSARHPGQPSPTPLRGREREVALFRRAMTASRLRTIVLHGEVGIGKSRLAREFASISRDAGWAVGWGAWSEVPGREPSAILAAAVRSIAHDDAPVVLDGSVPASPVDRWRWLCDEIIDRAGGRRVLLVLDDLHWADAPVLDAIAYLAERRRSMRLTLCLAYRDEGGRSPAIASTLARFPRAGVLEMRLSPLSISASMALVHDVSRVRFSVATVRQLHALAAGNPLFLRELVLERNASGGGAPPATSARLEEFVAARLDRLESEAVQGLRWLSILGSEFDEAALNDLSAVAGRTLAGLLEEARASALLTRHPDGRTAFEHPIIRTVLYRGINAAERARMHGAIAERLAARGAAGDRELAFHFLRSDAPEHQQLGLLHAERAARAAEQARAPQAAYDIWQEALAAAERLGVDERRIVDWLLEFAPVANAVGAVDEALAAYERALAFFNASGDEIQSAEVSARIGWTLSVYGRRAGAVPYLARAVPLLTGSPSARNAVLLTEYGLALMSSGRLGEGAEPIAAGLHMARALGDREVIGVTSHLASIWHTWDQGDPALVPDLIADALRELKGRNETARCRAMVDAAMSGIVRGDLPGAERLLSQARAAARRVESLSSEVDVRALRSMLLTLRGEFAAAEDWRSTATITSVHPVSRCTRRP